MSTRINLKNFRYIGFVVLLAAAVLTSGMASLSRQKELTLVDRGICVVLADTDCKFAIDLAESTQLLIYVQLAPDQDLEATCKAADAAGFYGTRIFIDQGPMDKLHLADNLADLVIAGDAKGISETEVLRILRPGGKALLGKKKLTKKFPDGIDDWSHPYHGPDNNPQSLDQVATAPYLTQFFADPRYAPQTQTAVASAGRVFKAFGTLAFKKREEPFLNSLVAFNGYNGTILWRRDLSPGVMVHRNTMIATPDLLYVGDDKSCKIIDAATGRLKDEIIPPEDVAGGTFWKWMALEDGTLYALTGQAEYKEATVRARWENRHGWPWQVSKGFNAPDGVPDGQQAYKAHLWGFGKNVLAINPKTKKVLWSHHETEPVDSRAMCMKNGRIYIFAFGSYLACLDAKTGSEIWRKTPDNAPELFQALGIFSNRQNWLTNWRTTAYLKCSDKALYFAGPQVNKLLAVSTEDGSILWEDSYNNFQLVLRDDGLYAISGQKDDHPSKKFDPLTGKVLAEFDTKRRACTRPTGSADAVLYRAQGGSIRLNVATGTPEWISPMRAQCHDGVTIANGLLYWWPSTCDCELNIYGVTALGPAGDFDFAQKAVEDQRLETAAKDLTKVAPLDQTDADWPTFRANNQGTFTTDTTVAPKLNRLWWLSSGKTFTPTPPVAVDDLAFYGGSDGIVRAVDTATGQSRWKAYTAGSIRIAPSVWKGRLYVGSGDGYAYCFEAKTGRLLWRFRAAPIERRIPVYGTIQSTWPAAAGVIVEDGVAYVAAGIVNYDGIYVYALDAVTGKIKWQNTTSGHLLPGARTGVSVQGHMLINDKKLYLAGGTSISPAIYDITNGKCLNDNESLKTTGRTFPRGWELSKINDHIIPCGRPFYAHPEHPVVAASVTNSMFVSSTPDKDIFWVDKEKVVCFNRLNRQILDEYIAGLPTQHDDALRFNWRQFKTDDKPLWQFDSDKGVAIAAGKNSIVLAGVEPDLRLLDISTGKRTGRATLVVPVVPWGLAIDRQGRIIATLEGGQVMCFGKGS